MRIKTEASLVVVCAATLMLVAVPPPALAHEEREVGKYHFAVGFGSEPAYTGQQNSVQLLLHDASNQPVTDLTDTLSVEVIFGSGSKTLPLEPFFEVGEFGTPGDYRAWFFPTQPGSYTFRFTGSIKGQKVDASFTSGPTTFSSVQDPASVEFPVQVPPVAQVAALAQRLASRVQDAVAAQQQTRDSARSAKTVGYVGIAVGAVGVLLGGLALAMARRRTTAPAPEAAMSEQRRS